MDGSVARTAAHREVVGGEHDRPPVDLRGSRHEVSREDRGQAALPIIPVLPCLRVGREAGQRPDLSEAAAVGQPLDPLAHGEPA